MKRFAHLLIATLVFVGLGRTDVLAQFEGIVESKNLTIDETGKTQQFSMTMWIREGRMRVENGAIGSTPPSTMIYRNDKGVFWILNGEEKTYIEILLHPEVGETPKPPDAGERSRPTIKKTKRTRTVLGYPCEQYVVSRPGEETVIWGTKRLSKLLAALTTALGSGHQEADESWSDELTKMGIYPMLATTKVDGRVIESQEVVKIETRVLPQELFELPDGYQRESVEGGGAPEIKQ